MSIGFESEQIQLQKLRERLRKMSDEESIKFGKMVRQLCGNQLAAECTSCANQRSFNGT